MTTESPRNAELAEPWTAEDQAKFEAMLAARPEGEEIEGEQHFNQAVVCFLNGDLIGVNKSELMWSLAEPRIRKLLMYVAKSWRLEYIRECISRGSMMLAVFLDSEVGGLSGAGLIEVADNPSGQRAVIAYLHIFDPVDLSDLSEFCEILALGVDADASAIWSTLECEMLPGYDSVPCIFGQLQGVRIKPIH